MLLRLNNQVVRIRKLSAALQQTKLLSVLAQIGALSMIRFLYCWIIGLLETNLIIIMTFQAVFLQSISRSELEKA